MLSFSNEVDPFFFPLRTSIFPTLRVCMCMQKAYIRIHALNPNPETQEHSRIENLNLTT